MGRRRERWRRAMPSEVPGRLATRAEVGLYDDARGERQQAFALAEDGQRGTCVYSSGWIRERSGTASGKRGDVQGSAAARR